VKVKLLTSLASARSVYSAGDEYECSADEAQRLIDKGFAETVRTKPVEKAVRRSKPEKAAK